MTTAQTEIQNNPILKSIQSKLISQTEKGLKKYGNSVNPSEYTTAQWVDHLQEELIDALVYAETIKSTVTAHVKKLGSPEYRSILDDRPSYEKQIAQAQSMLHKKDAELSRLRVIENDYQKLEVDYLNTVTENKRLIQEIVDMGQLSDMNNHLMKQVLRLNTKQIGAYS